MSLLDSLAGLASTIYNVTVGERHRKEDKQFAHNEAELASQRQMEMQNKLLAYNDPSAQMSRMQGAGLNPDLMYGQMSSQVPVAGSGSQAGSPSTPVQYVDPLTLSQVNLNNAQATKIESETDYQNLQNDYYAQVKDTLVSMTKEEYNKLVEDTNISRQTAIEMVDAYTIFTSGKDTAKKLGYSDDYILYVFNKFQDPHKESVARVNLANNEAAAAKAREELDKQTKEYNEAVQGSEKQFNQWLSDNYGKNFWATTVVLVRELGKAIPNIFMPRFAPINLGRRGPRNKTTVTDRGRGNVTRQYEYYD